MGVIIPYKNVKQLLQNLELTINFCCILTFNQFYNSETVFKFCLNIIIE